MYLNGKIPIERDRDRDRQSKERKKERKTKGKWRIVKSKGEKNRCGGSQAGKSKARLRIERQWGGGVILQLLDLTGRTNRREGE